MTPKLFLFISLLVITFCGYSQHFNSEKLDTYLNVLEENDQFMASVAVSWDGNIIYTKSIGYADIASGTKASEHTRYRIGSISKTFTAVLIFKAFEENKLKPDQTIHKFFPKVKNAKKITIDHLLQHRSGIFNFTNNPRYFEWNTTPKTKAEMIKIISDGPSVFEPGIGGQYSNSNYVLLTFILEKIYRKSYAELVEEKITRPLGLNNTYPGKKIELNNNECNSYNYLAGWELSEYTDPSITSGAGAMVSNPTDLVKFTDALFGGKLVSAESLERMKNIEDGYGMGLLRLPFYDKYSYGHTGGVDGFSAVAFSFPDDKISYAVTSNGYNYDPNEVVIAILSTVYNKDYEIPEFKTYNIAVEELDKFTGEYASLQIPLKMTVTRKNNSLIAQATGQPAFTLTPTADNVFEYEIAGVVMEFDANENKMVLKQNGGTFIFLKK